MSETTASCLCGDLKVAFTGEPVKRGICHCHDCRKISGCHYSDNAVVLDSQFKLVSGTPGQYTKTAGSGLPITSYFCAKCGVTVYRTAEKMQGLTIIKAGTIDDTKWQERTKPDGEVFTQSKVAWVNPLG